MALDFNPADFEPVLKALAVAGLPTLEQTLTTVVADSVAGPFGDFVSQAVNPLWSNLNHALGLDAATPPAETAAAITALPPEDAKAKLAAVQEQHAYLLDDFRARSSAALAVQQQGDRTSLSGDAAQLDMDRQAADSASFFVYGPRPAILWGVGALIIAYGAAPLFGWFMDAVRSGDWSKVVPALPWYVWLCAFALLGIVSALRSLDKKNGTAGLPPAAPAALPPAKRR